MTQKHVFVLALTFVLTHFALASESAVAEAHIKFHVSHSSKPGTKGSVDDLEDETKTMTVAEINDLLSRVETWKSTEQNKTAIEPHKNRIYALKQLLDGINKQWNGLALKVDQFMQHKDNFKGEKAKVLAGFKHYMQQIERQIAELSTAVHHEHEMVVYAKKHPEEGFTRELMKPHTDGFMATGPQNSLRVITSNHRCGQLYYTDLTKWNSRETAQIGWLLNTLDDVPESANDIRYQGIYFSNDECTHLVEQRLNITSVDRLDPQMFCDDTPVCETPLARVEVVSKTLTDPKSYLCAAFLCIHESEYVWDRTYFGKIVMPEPASERGKEQRETALSTSASFSIKPQTTVVVVAVATLFFLAISVFILVV